VICSSFQDETALVVEHGWIEQSSNAVMKFGPCIISSCCIIWVHMLHNVCQILTYKGKCLRTLKPCWMTTYGGLILTTADCNADIGAFFIKVWICSSCQGDKSVQFNNTGSGIPQYTSSDNLCNVFTYTHATLSALFCKCRMPYLF
jgi:hypothetical protein